MPLSMPGVSDQALVQVAVQRSSIYRQDRVLAGQLVRLSSLDLADGPGRELPQEVWTLQSLLAATRPPGQGLLILSQAGDAIRTGLLATLAPAAGLAVLITTADLTDAALVQGCAQLADQGVMIALAGPVPAGRLPDFIGLIVLDATGEPGLRQQLNAPAERPMQVLATNLQTQADYDLAIELAVDLFSGPAAQPIDTKARRPAEASQLGRLRTAASVLSNRLEFEELEEVLRCEPALTYRVLQLASLGQIGETKRQIHSIHEALVMVGSFRIQNWLALLLASDSGGGSTDAMLATLTRARACELLAASQAIPDARNAFTAGMLSNFDRLLQIPVPDLREVLLLSEDLQEAAFGSASELSRLVRAVIACEAGQPPSAGPASEAQLTLALARGLGWALAVGAGLAAA